MAYRMMPRRGPYDILVSGSFEAEPTALLVENDALMVQWLTMVNSSQWFYDYRMVDDDA